MAPPVELTITQLAERTGIRAGTLRMWGVRHDFPQSTRPGERPRYSDRDVTRVLDVVRYRDQGFSLPAAIRRASAGDHSAPTSIFARLRERRPDVQPVVLRKGTLLIITRAIEDEWCAQAASGVVIGSFQRVRFYRQSERRWQEVARTAKVAVVLADFDRLQIPTGRPIEVPVGREHASTREWTVVMEAPGACACLSARELPAIHRLPDERRRFEVLWSPEPEAVRAALATAADVIADQAPAVGRRLYNELERTAPHSTPQLWSAAALAQRMIGYLGRIE